MQVALLRNSINLAVKQLKDWMAPDKVVNAEFWFFKLVV